MYRVRQAYYNSRRQFWATKPLEILTAWGIRMDKMRGTALEKARETWKNWQNDMAKFTSEGDVVAKVITNPAEFDPTKDFEGNPHKFVLPPTKYEIKAVDVWAAKTHFNANESFSLTGLEAILKRVGVHQ